MRRPSHTEGSGYQSMAWWIPLLSGYKLNTLGMQQTYLKLMYKEVIIIEMHQNNTNFQLGLTLRQSHHVKVSVWVISYSMVFRKQIAAGTHFETNTKRHPRF